MSHQLKQEQPPPSQIIESLFILWEMNGFLHSFRFEMTQRDAVRWRFSVNNSWNLKTFVRQISVWNVRKFIKVVNFSGRRKAGSAFLFFWERIGQKDGTPRGNAATGRRAVKSLELQHFGWLGLIRTQSNTFFL